MADTKNKTNTVLASSMLGYVTGLGVSVPDIETVRKEVEDEFRQSLGVGCDWNFTQETILGRLIEAIAISRVGTLGTNAYVANQMDLFKSTGRFLDGIGAIFRMNRLGGLVASVRMEAYADDWQYEDGGTKKGIVLKKGLVFTSAGGVNFVLNSDVPFSERLTVQKTDTEGNPVYHEETLPDGTVTKTPVMWYYVSFSVEAMESGERSGNELECNTGTYVRPEGATDEGDYGLSKVERFRTVNVISYGTETEEPDVVYRRRMIKSRWTGVSFMEAMNAALNSIEGVNSFRIIENVSNQPIFTPNCIDNGFTSVTSNRCFIMTGHSVLITVDGGDANQIAKAIFRNKSSGSTMLPIDVCPTNAPIGRVGEKDMTEHDYPERTPYVLRVSVADDAYGNHHEVIFNRPVPVGIYVKIIVEKNKYANSPDVLDIEIRDVIRKWQSNAIDEVEGVTVGENVYGDEIASALTKFIPAIRIRNVLIAQEVEVGTADEFISWSSEVGVNEWEIAVVKDVRIEVQER